MEQHAPEDFYVSIVSFHEQMLGWNAYIHRAKTADGVVHGYRRFHLILADFAAMQILPFDPAAAEVYEFLRKQRVRIGTMDLRIAATALAQGFRVLTRNTRDFTQVPGLQVEDWTVA
jgi:tRNA(fMet)-specific endonuclease VapC